MPARQKITDEPPAPGPKTIHPVFAWPVIFVCALYAVVWCYRTALADQFSPWWLGLLGLVVAMAGTTAAKWGWDYVTYGDAMAGEGRTLAWVGGIFTSVWLIWAGINGTEGRNLAPLGIAAIALGGWYAALWLHAQKEKAARGRKIADVLEHDHLGTWRNILDRAGCRDILITNWEEHRAGLRITCTPDPAEMEKQPKTYSDFQSRSGKIATVAAMTYKKEGKALPVNAIRILPGVDDASFLLNVTERDVFDANTVYAGDTGPADIRTPRNLGDYQDGSNILLSLLSGHMKIVGMTGAGKSVLANNIIGRISGCYNALVWVCATDKLIPLVWPWLQPFFAGKAVRPAIDWVAGNHPDRVLEMLAAAYKLCCERNNRLGDETKIDPSAKEPAVFVILEEMSHAVEFKNRITTFDGKVCTIGDLVNMILRAGRSARVQLILMSQLGINAGLGDRAAEMMRNLVIRICLRTTEAHDGYRTLQGLPQNVDTTKMPINTMYVQPSVDEPRIEPGKAAKLDGSVDVAPVAIKQAPWRPTGVESESDLGPTYAYRWEEDRHPELSRQVARKGHRWALPDDAEPPPGLPAPAPEPYDVGGPAGGAVAVTNHTDIPEPVERPDDPGGPHPMDTTFTDQDWSAFNQLLGGTGEEKPPPSAPFQLPDSTGANRLRFAAGQMGKGSEPRDPVQPARPVPEPLGSIIAVLDGLTEPSEWYATEELAGLIGWPIDDVPRLGTRLTEILQTPSTNLPRSLDPQRRKGRRVVDLREAATRYRFGL